MFDDKYYPPAKEQKLIMFIIMLGLGLRVIYSIYDISLIHADEHFQLLEPAYRVIHNFGVKTWEWEKGLRSWVGPAFYLPIVYFGKILGINGGYNLIVICKIWTSLFWAISAYFFHQTLVNLNWNYPTRILGLLLYCFWNISVFWTTSTLSENLALISTWIGIWYWMKKVKIEKISNREHFLIALLLTIPYLFRLQILAFTMPILGLTIFFIKRPHQIKSILFSLLGIISVILAQGLLDLMTWGIFLNSTITNIRLNLFENVASRYGVSPFYQYPLFLWNSLDIISKVIISYLFFVVIISRFKNKFINSVDHRILVISLSALIFFIVHSLIPHKELRFLLPIFPVSILIIGEFLNIFPSKKISSFILSSLLILTISSPLYLFSSKWDKPIYRGDSSYFATQNSHFARHYPDLETLNICLYHLPWSGTRGLMGIGRNANLKKIKFLDTKILVNEDCHFILGWSTNIDQIKNYSPVKTDHKKKQVLLVRNE